MIGRARKGSGAKKKKGEIDGRGTRDAWAWVKGSGKVAEVADDGCEEGRGASVLGTWYYSAHPGRWEHGTRIEGEVSKMLRGVSLLRELQKAPLPYLTSAHLPASIIAREWGAPSTAHCRSFQRPDSADKQASHKSPGPGKAQEDSA